MQNLSGTSSGKNNKSCSIFHNESNKISFAFFDVSTIFYAIYKKQQNHFTIGVTLSQLGPRKDLLFCNVAPRRRPAVVRPNSGQVLGGPWVLGDRFPCLDGAGWRPARGGAGGQAWWPPRLDIWRRGLDAGGVGRLGS
jgi:hypothetical protein